MSEPSLYEECGVPWTEDESKTCLQKGKHSSHYVFVDGARVFWPNGDHRPPTNLVDAEKAQRNDFNKIHEAKREMARESVRRSVGVNDPKSRREGSDKALDAVEEEFLVAALQACRDIMTNQKTMTADDVWEVLEGRQIFTKHPKAMAGILRRAIGQKIMEPVPKDGPDAAYRSPRRSNESRLLRVYQSLVYVGDKKS